MNRIEKWAAEGVVYLEISEAAQNEAGAGKDSQREYREYKACSYAATETLLSYPHERKLWQRIEAILCPSGVTSKNQKRDIEIVFNVIKYEAILITDDGASESQPGGILGKRDELSVLGAIVMRDEEVVGMVEELIRQRDELAKRLCREAGEPLPTWIGND
jgi:hypothetical protein